MVLWISNLFVVLYLPYLAIWAGGGPWANDASYVQGDWFGYGFLPALVATIVFAGYLLTWGWLASLVDYRLRDGLLFLIPIYGWIFIATILYRLCAYQVRDWPPAPEHRVPGRLEARFRRLIAW